MHTRLSVTGPGEDGAGLSAVRPSVGKDGAGPTPTYASA